MVEAPRIRITFQNIQHIRGHKIINAIGTSYTKTGINITNYTVSEIWYVGKYIFIRITHEDMPEYVVRTHMMMYGRITLLEIDRAFMTWTLDDRTKISWRTTQITFLDSTCDTPIKSNYTICPAQQLIDASYQMMKYDISHSEFDRFAALAHIDVHFDRISDDILTDLLLDQEFFPGVGNILQQEALYRCSYLPTRTVSSIGLDGIACLVDKLKHVIDLLYMSYINGHQGPIFFIYHKKFCPLGHKTLTKYLGYHNRRTTWCPTCQK